MGCGSISETEMTIYFINIGSLMREKREASLSSRPAVIPRPPPVRFLSICSFSLSGSLVERR